VIQLIRDIDQDFEKQLQKESSITTKKECDVYINNILNILDRIAYLHKYNKENESIANYFKTWFSYGKTLMNIRCANMNDDNFNWWPELTKYFDKQEIQAAPLISLVEFIQNYSKLK
jgi:hypothetical protein